MYFKETTAIAIILNDKGNLLAIMTRLWQDFAHARVRDLLAFRPEGCFSNISSTY